MGSTFTVELAAAHLSTELSAVAAATAGGPAKPGPRADVRGTVLYIDDDEVNRLLMQAFLAWRPGVALHLATDGLSGIHEAARCRPDLILIDIRLPDLSGIDVLRAIRAGAAARPAPCVAVSAEAMPEEVERALAAGFDGYLTKPLAAAVLLAEIDRRLGAPRQAAPAA